MRQSGVDKTKRRYKDHIRRSNIDGIGQGRKKGVD